MGGRQRGVPNKVGREVRELAQKHGPKVLQGLVDMANNEDTPHAARVAASREILDRAYGKPAQSITPPDGQDAHQHVVNIMTGVPRPNAS